MAKPDKKDNKKASKAKVLPSKVQKTPVSPGKIPISSTEILAKAAASKGESPAQPKKKKVSDKAGNGKPKIASSSEESSKSSSEDEKPKVSQVKVARAKAKAASSSDSEGSDDGESEDERPTPKTALSAKSKPTVKSDVAKSRPTKKESTKVPVSSSDESSESSSSEESDQEKVKSKLLPTKPAGKVTIAPVPKTAAQQKKKSKDESSSDSSSESDDKPPAAPKVKVAPSEPSSEGSEDEAPAKPTSSKPSLPKVKNAIPKETTSSSSSEDSSDGDSKKPANKGSSSSEESDDSEQEPSKAVKVSKAETSSDEENDDASEDEDENGDVKMAEVAVAAQQNTKRKAVEEAPVATKKQKLANGHAEPAGEKAEETKAVFVGSLSWSVDSDRLAEEFSSCGEVVSATVQTDRNTGRSRGFGYVHFATVGAVEKALAMSGKEIDGRPINVDRSTQQDKARAKENRAKAFGDTTSPASSTLFLGNLSFNTSEDAVWSFFNDYGVKSVRLPTERETGRPKGFGYVEFEDIEGAKKAFSAANGAEIDGRSIRVDFSQPRDGPSGGRGDRGGRGQGRGRGRGNDHGGRGRGGFRGGGFRGGVRGNARSGGITAFEGRKTTF